MSDSLSIILPVHNAQNTLAADVAEVLDTMADLTSKFELLIMDDGSSDDTEEIAHDLARTYPQVQVSRHRNPQGTDAALQNGLSRVGGDIVFLCDTAEPVSATDLRRMWSMRHDEAHHGAIHGQPKIDLSATWLSRLMAPRKGKRPGLVRTIRSSQFHSHGDNLARESKETSQATLRISQRPAAMNHQQKSKLLMRIRDFAIDE